MLSSPRRHHSHSPHQSEGLTTTRSPIARRVHPVAHLGDDAGDVAPAHVRHGGLDRQAAAHPEVQVVQRRRLHLQQHLARAGRRPGHVFDADHLGPAVLVEDRRAHAVIASG
jgi:hypothetical protein